MSRLVDQLASLVPHWSTRLGHVVYGTITGGAAFTVLAPLGGHVAATAALAVTAISAIWLWRASMPPKPLLGKIAIAVAIRGETDEDQAIASRDLVEALQRSLHSDPQGDLFQVIHVPRYLCVGVAETHAAECLRERCRAHLLVWGDIRTRNVDGARTRELALEGVVGHAPIAADLGSRFSAEMRALIPREFQIDCRSDLQGFRIATENLHVAAQYIVSVAAMLSLDFRLALGLLEQLEHVAETATSAQHARILTDLVPKRIAECELGVSRLAHVRWRLTRDPAELEICEDSIDRYARRAGEDANFLVAKAICDVVLRGDCARALTRLIKCAAQRPRDPVCRYGIAFCRAVSGDLDGAYRDYRTAIDLDNESPGTAITGEPIAFEVEEFLEWYVKRHPTLVQLHYCLGLLNKNRKKDQDRATSDFTKFLDSPGADQFPNAVAAATKYIATQGHN